jgi:hypothetical protein
MNPLPSSERSRRGSSWVEVAVVIAVLVVGAMMVLPSLTRTRRHAHPIACVNSLKQVGTAFRLYANDYEGKYPFQVLAEEARSKTNSSPFGPFDPTNPAELWRVLQAAGNELSSPRILICPADEDRVSATDFNEGQGLTAQSFSHPTQRLKALSYFYGLNAREDDPNQLVTGDRNLTSAGTDTNPTKSLLTGQVDLAQFFKDPKTPNGNLRWGLGLHDKAGNVGFSDGSVQQLTSGKLREAAGIATTNGFALYGAKQNPLWLPNLPEPKR